MELPNVEELHNFGYGVGTEPVKVVNSNYRVFTRDLSLSQVADIANTPPPYGGSSDKNGSWAGSESLAKARDLLITGDHDLLVESNELLSELESQLLPTDNTICQRDYSPRGRLVDRSRFQHGDPVCVYHNRELLGESNKVTIMSNIAYSGCTDHRAIMANGVAILSIIRTLQDNGYSVKLLIGNPTSQNGFLQSDLITLKEYDGYIDQSVAAFWFGHPSALRRIGFRLNEHHPKLTRNFMGWYEQGGYGRCCELPEQTLKQLGVDIYFPWCTIYSTEAIDHLSKFFSPEYSPELSKQLAKFGLTKPNLLKVAA